MENGDSENSIKSSYAFLETNEAKQFFADADYYLKNGMHIQRGFPKPEGIFMFIYNFSSQLQKYYKDFFDVHLTSGGEEWNRYYYIDFNEGDRGNISVENRKYLQTEYLIIGYLLISICKIDAHIEIDTVNDFKRILRQEYDEYKEGLYGLFANVKGEKDSEYTDEKVNNIIDNAFWEFSKLGWIDLNKESRNEFKIMPSIERLRKMQEAQIQNIEDIIKQSEKNEISSNT